MTIAERFSSSTSRPRRILITMRDELRRRRTVRASYRELERSLSSYSSRTEADDLLAMIAHQDGPDAERIRRIVARNVQSRTTRQIAA